MPELAMEGSGPRHAGRGLRLENLSKQFGGRPVLRDVSLEVRPGEVHCLIGQNGSGKSTLIKVLAGQPDYDPDEGARAWVGGESLSLGSPTAAHAAGLRFVHQDLALILELNAMDNLGMVGTWSRTQGRLINWRGQRKLAEEALALFGVEVDVTVPLGHLSPVERTAVAIVRALHGWAGDSGILVLDEPTASLSSPEVARLHQLVTHVASSGAGVVYVSHRLDDVIDVADRVSVLRDGSMVGTYDAGSVTASDLAELMVGHAVEQKSAGRRNFDAAASALDVVSLSGHRVDRISLKIRQGEVVGVAGVLGSGREEVPYLVAAAVPWASGEVSVDGTSLTGNRPRAAKTAGIGFVPGDRGAEAVIGALPMGASITVANLENLSRSWLINRAKERAEISEWVAKAEVVPALPENPLPTFSGGNQQKVIVARALSRNPKVLVLSEPTAGVDIGAREALYDLIKSEVGARGLAVLVASSDPQDLVALCHRVVVMRGGRVVRELVGDEVTYGAIVHAAEVAEVEPQAQEEKTS